MADKTEKRITEGDVHDLAVVVRELVEEARLLRMSLDELRDDVIWAARQVLATGYQISGTPPPAPRDPLAPDMPASSVKSVPPTIDQATDRRSETTGVGPQQPTPNMPPPGNTQGTLWTDK